MNSTFDPDEDLYGGLETPLPRSKGTPKKKLHSHVNSILQLENENELKEKIRKLEETENRLRNENKILVRNISVLFNTAKAEISRKNNEIQRLRATRGPQRVHGRKRDLEDVSCPVSKLPRISSPEDTSASFISQKARASKECAPEECAPGPLVSKKKPPTQWAHLDEGGEIPEHFAPHIYEREQRDALSVLPQRTHLDRKGEIPEHFAPHIYEREQRDAFSSHRDYEPSSPYQYYNRPFREDRRLHR